MGFKQEDGTWKNSATDEKLFKDLGLTRAEGQTEPIWIFRAQDKLAPEKIRDWAREASVNGCSHSKVKEAFATADAMEKWPNRKYPD